MTSVGEEGLDFPACALVIRYDINLTMIGYLQSRGRARQKESEYVVLVDKYDPNQLEAYRVSALWNALPPRLLMLIARLEIRRV